jgi:Flp pilus assembly protein TadG
MVYVKRISDIDSALIEECGQEIAEAALVLPILFLVLLAIFWFGRAFNIAGTVERAAQHGIQTAAQLLCASCGNTVSTNAQIVASVSSVLQNDHLDPANLTAYSPPFACTPATAPTCTTTSNVEICTGAPLSCGSASCQSPPAACAVDASLDGVRVSFGYRFTTPLPIASLSAITIPASAESPSEQ